MSDTNVTPLACQQMRRLVADGRSLEAVGELLGYGESTVSDHVQGDCSHDARDDYHGDQTLQNVERDVRKHIRRYLAATDDEIGVRIALHSILDDIKRFDGGGGGD